MRAGKHHASVLILTLLFMSGISFITQQLLRQATVFSAFGSSAIAREQAKLLALGGLQLAVSSLTEHTKELDDAAGAQKKKKDPDYEQRALLERVLPHMNRWQVFPLKEQFDGIEGEVKICLSCEEGKININEIFDFKKNEFKSEYVPLIQRLVLGGGGEKASPGEVLKKLTEFFKKRKRKLDDVSELLEIEGFGDLPLFYQPPKVAKKKGEVEEQQEVHLYDLFTVWSGKPTLELLFLSDALCRIIGVRRPLSDDAKARKDKFKAVVKNFKKSVAANWDANWSVVQPMYDKKPTHLSKLLKIFSKQFDPVVYTVLSSGSVRGIEHAILALITLEKQTPPAAKNEKKKTEPPTQKGAPRMGYKILKLYWL